jgi:hypothetical protein
MVQESYRARADMCFSCLKDLLGDDRWSVITAVRSVNDFCRKVEVGRG